MIPSEAMHGPRKDLMINEELHSQCRKGLGVEHTQRRHLKEPRTLFQSYMDVSLMPINTQIWIMGLHN